MKIFIKKPIISEKTKFMKDNYNKYTFFIQRNYNKYQIKDIIEKLFDVTVEKVYTLNCKGKRKKINLNYGYKNDLKKIIVRLKNGHEINISDNI
jgi:large subunit ribosomal protein L23